MGSKIRVSGGGRCNFTNTGAASEHYYSKNPHFCKSALARFSPSDFIALLEKYRVRYHEEAEGRLFCDRGSAEILRMLAKECEEASVRFLLNTSITHIGKETLFEVRTNRGIFHSESLVIATGGLSYPQLGASPFGYRLAKRFAIGVTPLSPALVPLSWNRPDKALFSELGGISLGVAVGAGGLSFSENILFTHTGVSGPVMLQASLYWNEGDPLVVDLFPGTDIEAVFMSKRSSRVEMSSLLSGFMPKRFVRAWCSRYIDSRPMNTYSDPELSEIARRLHNWNIRPAGTGGYRQAEVTRGGVDTRELSSRTMEARNVPGLFFAGEVLDVTGQLGGYNLQWAWSSGFAAGQHA
jgi:predicted Rossmann fold flavoprotein